MLDHDEKSKKFVKGLWNFAKGFTLLLTYEVIEELLEEAIAWTITTIATRAISFVIVVLLTQTTKVTVKGLAKGLTILLKPVVKKITYRAGNDKVEKIRRIYKTMKNAVAKFFAFVVRNKKSITSTVVSLLSSVGAGVGADGAIVFFGVTLPEYAYYLIAAGVAIVMFAFTELGIAAKGWENQKEYDERLAKEQAEKDEKKALKEAELEEKARQEAMLKLAEAEEAKLLEAEQEKEAEKAKLKAEQEEQRKQIELKEELNRKRIEYNEAVAKGEFEGTFLAYLSKK